MCELVDFIGELAELVCLNSDLYKIQKLLEESYPGLVCHSESNFTDIEDSSFILYSLALWAARLYERCYINKVELRQKSASCSDWFFFL